MAPAGPRAAATGRQARLAPTQRRWERGEHKPGERYREQLAEVYDDSAPDELQPESILDDMQRRPFLRGLGAFIGLAAASTLV